MILYRKKLNAIFDHLYMQSRDIGKQSLQHGDSSQIKDVKKNNWKII